MGRREGGNLEEDTRFYKKNLPYFISSCVWRLLDLESLRAEGNFFHVQVRFLSE